MIVCFMCKQLESTWCLVTYFLAGIPVTATAVVACMMHRPFIFIQKEELPYISFIKYFLPKPLLLSQQHISRAS